MNDLPEVYRKQKDEGTLPEVRDCNDKPWGVANERRGGSSTDLAIEFVKDFPLGSNLSVEQFDQWAHDHERLTLPSARAMKDKQSDGWKAHLMRRHEVKKSINSAGAHPRLTKRGSTPFWIASTGYGYLTVRSPQDTVARGELGRKVASITDTHRRLLDYLMQSAEWSKLSPNVQAKVETLYENIVHFKGRVDLEIGYLRTQGENVEALMRREGVSLIEPPEED